MRRIMMLITLVAVLGSLVCVSFMDVYAQKKATFPFYVYRDKLSRDNHYSPSGWMGDHGAMKLNDGWKTDSYSGKTCIQWKYSGEATQGAGWAGCYWQNPSNNWGRVAGGFDITGAKKISFWARGGNGGEIVEFKIGGIMGDYSDTDEATTGPISLSKEWKEYTIDLSEADLSYISGGFCWIASSIDVPAEGIVFYLDDIVYLSE